MKKIISFFVLSILPFIGFTQATIYGSVNVCQPSVEIYWTESGMSDYVWSITGSCGTIINGQGTNEITIEWDN